MTQVKDIIDHPQSENEDHWVIAWTEEEAMKKTCDWHGVTPEKVKLIQDEDVLDTWFSSGLFPFATLGWPNVENDDFKAFFPGDILETGHDIIFFWVAWMVMMSLCLLDKLPFKTVFLHALV